MTNLNLYYIEFSGSMLSSFFGSGMEALYVVADSYNQAEAKAMAVAEAKRLEQRKPDSIVNEDGDLVLDTSEPVAPKVKKITLLTENLVR